MRCLLASAAAVLLVALSGCAQGGSNTTSSSANFKGDEKLIANTVEDFQTNVADHSGTKICETLITSELADRITAKNSGASCATTVTAAMKATDQADLTVTDVAIDPKDDNKATAKVTAKTGDKSSKSYEFSFVRVDQRWQISSFG
ncbi:MAG: hypothetical protein F2813_07755 [Actinobacteria bacterium]|nr:hypothetical protein [Actinomycetota bacterium]